MVTLGNCGLGTGVRANFTKQKLSELLLLIQQYVLLFIHMQEVFAFATATLFIFDVQHEVKAIKRLVSVSQYVKIIIAKLKALLVLTSLPRVVAASKIFYSSYSITPSNLLKQNQQFLMMLKYKLRNCIILLYYPHYCGLKENDLLILHECIHKKVNSICSLAVNTRKLTTSKNSPKELNLLLFC